MEEDAEKFVDACGRGDLRQVTKFLSSHEDVKKHIPEGLFRAIRRGKMEVVDMLLKEDFDINYINERFGETALSMACWSGQVDIVSKLLQRRDIDINKMNMSGSTALHQSLYNIAIGGSDVIFNMLMDRPDLIINHHLSPSSTMTQLQSERFTLKLAVDWGMVDSVRRLISSGADFDFDRSALTAELMFRCSPGPGEHKTAITAMLLEAGFRPCGGVDDVRQRFEENAQIQALMMTAASKPLSLKQACRKSIWRILRTSTGGRIIAPGIDELKHQLPGPLIKYLKFEA